MVGLGLGEWGSWGLGEALHTCFQEIMLKTNFKFSPEEPRKKTNDAKKTQAATETSADGKGVLVRHPSHATFVFNVCHPCSASQLVPEVSEWIFWVGSHHQIPVLLLEKAQLVSSAPWLFITINMGVCIREGFSSSQLHVADRQNTHTHTKQTNNNKKQAAAKLQDYSLVWRRRDNHLKQMIHKGTVTNLTNKHEIFNCCKTKMN